LILLTGGAEDRVAIRYGSNTWLTTYWSPYTSLSETFSHYIFALEKATALLAEPVDNF
jgi:hypothetical protein